MWPLHLYFDRPLFIVEFFSLIMFNHIIYSITSYIAFLRLLLLSVPHRISLIIGYLTGTLVAKWQPDYLTNFKGAADTAAQASLCAGIVSTFLTCLIKLWRGSASLVSDFPLSNLLLSLPRVHSSHVRHHLHSALFHLSFWFSFLSLDHDMHGPFKFGIVHPLHFSSRSV